MLRHSASLRASCSGPRRTRESQSAGVCISTQCRVLCAAAVLGMQQTVRSRLAAPASLAASPARALLRAATPALRPACHGASRLARPGRARLAQRALPDEGLAEDEVGNMLRIDLESDGGLGGTSEERFGPDALLLCGFLREEVSQVRAALDDMGADFVRTNVLQRDMVSLTLGEALAMTQESFGALALGTPRLVFLSGMSGQEAVAVIDAINDLGLPEAIFAAAVPRSVDKPLSELFLEIAGDHERLRAMRQAA